MKKLYNASFTSVSILTKFELSGNKNSAVEFTRKLTQIVSE